MPWTVGEFGLTCSKSCTCHSPRILQLQSDDWILKYNTELLLFHIGHVCKILCFLPNKILSCNIHSHIHTIWIHRYDKDSYLSANKPTVGMNSFLGLNTDWFYELISRRPIKTPNMIQSNAQLGVWGDTRNTSILMIKFWQ